MIAVDTVDNLDQCHSALLSETTSQYYVCSVDPRCLVLRRGEGTCGEAELAQILLLIDTELRDTTARVGLEFLCAVVNLGYSAVIGLAASGSAYHSRLRREVQLCNTRSVNISLACYEYIEHVAFEVELAYIGHAGAGDRCSDLSDINASVVELIQKTGEALNGCPCG